MGIREHVLYRPSYFIFLHSAFSLSLLITSLSLSLLVWHRGNY